MKRKVVLISIDGMRPDGFLNCNHPFIHELMERGSYTLVGSSVNPPVTLPCHMSIFHSVTPERHGVVTNTFVPMVRPISGLFEQIHYAGGTSTMFYGWEPLREVSRPYSLNRAGFICSYLKENTDRMLAEESISCIKSDKPDFVFLYMVETDQKGGHDNAWMSDEYLKRVHDAIENVKNVMEVAGDEYTIIVTSDHGGHERTHGVNIPEDMTIPMFFVGPDFIPGMQIPDVSLLDIAPTIATIMGISIPREWEGKSIVKVERDCFSKLRKDKK